MEGTPAYLPPEVLLGQEEVVNTGAGSSSDAWALGCVMHFVMTGRPPFFGSRDQVQSILFF